MQKNPKKYEEISKFPLVYCFLAICCLYLSAGLYEALADGDDIADLKKLYVRPATVPYPSGNPYSLEKEELGKALFFDPRLSASGTQSCATCHNPAFAWEDGMALGTGNAHKKLARSTPVILNLAWDDLYFWDGRAASLEEQALMPIESPNEMNRELAGMVRDIGDIHGYAPLFARAFPEDGGSISKENVARAVATFERGVISGKAPFDRWIEGDEKALSEPARRGFVLFNEKANCAACHSGWRFSDGSFHDTGLDDPDIGRGKILPQVPAMRHAFKTVGLRNIAQRGPYMHNGSLKTLQDVIDHYDHGFVRRESLSEEIKPLNLTPQEKEDLAAFLESLSSEDPPVTIPVLPK